MGLAALVVNAAGQRSPGGRPRLEASSKEYSLMKSILRLAALLLIALFLDGRPSRAADPEATLEPPIQLFMEDGQFISHAVRVFVKHPIPETSRPALTLIGTRGPFAKKVSVYPSGKDGHKTTLIGHAVNQSWIHEIDGQKVATTGTILLYDISAYDMAWFKPVARVVPMVSWTELDDDGKPRSLDALTLKPINVANVFQVYIWTMILVLITLISIVALCQQVKGNAIYLLCEKNGKLSLSRSQIAAWTLAIGSMVFASGMRKLEVPEIPETLLFLMGISLLTGGVSHVRGQKPAPEDGATLPEVAAPLPTRPRLYHLITDIGPGGALELSIARSQMVLWTVLILVLFVVKSFLDGVLWEVPTEMVILMGMSQAGYLAPKLMEPTKSKPEADS